MSDIDAESMLRRMDGKAEMIAPVYPSLLYSRDPKDEPIANLAIQEKADFIVSRDKDILELDNSRDFGLHWPFLRIVNPPEFLAAIAASPPALPENVLETGIDAE